MIVIIVDDEELSRVRLVKTVMAVEPAAELHVFNSALLAYEYVQEHHCDVAVLDIMGMDMDGVAIASKMTEQLPHLNIIFATGYSEYALDAFDLNASAYLMKPVTEDAIRRAFCSLRYPLKDQSALYVKCFGHFSLFMEGKPIRFKRAKTKELFAYLFDRRGSACTNKEIICSLWEEEGHESYYKQIRKDLIDTFRELGLSNLIIRDTGSIAIAFDAINSDLKDYIQGKAEAKNSYCGEYMIQYSWAEPTNAWLQMRKNE